MSIDDGVITFSICIRDLKATDLTTRHRFKEKLKVILEVDDKRFKTRKQLVGGGDVAWKYVVRFEWQLRQPRTSDTFEALKKELQSRFFKATLTCQHDRKKNPLGSVSLDLLTACTGPVDHNLPIKNADGVTVGRLNFSLEMTQLSNVAVIFKYIRVRNLRSVEPHVQGVNPYLKYGYSKQWPLIQERKLKAVYSSIQQQNSSPEWRDLPWLRFKTSLNELVRESIVVHITHKGRSHNIPIGRVNLLFRTLVDNGKSFKEEDTISFKGPLKVDNAEIEGTLNFKFLPRFAQMVPINVIRKAIHTEKGIFDAMPLLPWLPKPAIPMLRSSEVETSLDTNSPMLKKNPRNRASSIDKSDSKQSEETKKKSSKSKRKSTTKEGLIGDKKEKMSASKKSESAETSESESDSDSDLTESEEESTKHEKLSKDQKTTSFCDDLIDLSSPAMKRDRAMTSVDKFSFPLAASMSSISTTNNGMGYFQPTFLGTQPFVGNCMSLSLAPNNTLSLSSSSDNNLNNTDNDHTGDTSPADSNSSSNMFNPFAQKPATIVTPFGPSIAQQPISNPFAVA